MANPYLSGRIPIELNKQIEEYLARSGESKTEMITKAVSAYIGIELPSPKENSDKRLEILEQEISELKGAVKSLHEKLVNHINIEESVNTITTLNNDSLSNSNKASELKNNNATIESGKNFMCIETLKVCTLTGLAKTKIENLLSRFRYRLEKENRVLPRKQILKTPEKIINTKIEKITCELFYAGQSKEGKTLWNLIQKNSGNE